MKTIGVLSLNLTGEKEMVFVKENLKTNSYKNNTILAAEISITKMCFTNSTIKLFFKIYLEIDSNFILRVLGYRFQLNLVKRSCFFFQKF